MRKKTGLPEKNLGPSDDTAESTMNLNISVNDMRNISASESTNRGKVFEQRSKNPVRLSE
jgi:hypothetical protein